MEALLSLMPERHHKGPYLGLCDEMPQFVSFAMSLLHKGAYNRSLLCMEATFIMP